MKNIFIFLATLIFTNVSLAAVQHIKLSVPGMNCAVCPITVKKSLTSVEGVTLVKVVYDTKTAHVSYDDSLTDIDSLRFATEYVGYPSQLLKEKN
jgi:mercuric ion binding protein